MQIVSRVLAPLVALLLAASPAAALTLIRDAEVEQTLHRIAWPLFRAAGLNPASVHLYIVNDREPNAFVAGGQNIFVNTGLLTELDSFDQVRAVIAHELGHITGGHQTLRDQEMRGAGLIAGIGMLGAAAAAVGGSPQAGVAIATGASQVAQRSALAHSRAEEASADQAGLRYLAAAGSDPAAMLQVLDHFAGQEALLGSQMDAYAQNHPLWSDRIALIEERVAKMPHGSPPSAEDAYWYARMQAKLVAFLDSPAQTLHKYPDSDGSEPALLARAVAWHRRPDPARRHRQHGRAAPHPTRRPLLSGAEGPDPARVRPRGPRGGRLPQGGGAGPEGAADPGRARPGAAQHGRRQGHRRGPRRAGALDRRRQGERRRAARPGAGRGAARPRRRRGAGHRRALHPRGPVPRRRPQRPARGGAASGGLAGLAAGPGYDYHVATRAELRGPMRALLLSLTAAFAILAALPAAAQQGQSSPFSDSDKEALHAEIRAYLLQNPEILMEMIQLLEAKQQAATAEGDRELVASNAAAIFDDGFSWVGGNPGRQASPWWNSSTTSAASAAGRSPTSANWSRSDGDIRLIVKEMPILGPGSDLAARAAIATLITKGPETYAALHERLMALQGEVTDVSLDHALSETGLDPAEVRAAMADPEVDRRLAATRDLAGKLAIAGTPTFVFDNRMVRGYLPLAQMRDLVGEVRASN